MIVGTDGAVEAAHAADEERAQALAEAGGSLLAAAAAIRPSAPPVERVHVDLERGSLVVVRDAQRSTVATTVAEPTAGLVAFDLRAALRRPGRRRREARTARASPGSSRGSCCAGAARRSSVWSSRGRTARSSSSSDGTPEREQLVAIARGCAPMSAVDALGLRLLDVALLEGDFTLRSGKRSRWYLDKYRFETDPGLLRELGERLGAACAEAEPHAVRLAGPALGAVALAASAAMASGVPFIIVRDEAKGYGTGNRLEGPHEPGELVCLVEDVVTSGGALRDAVEAVRAAGLVVRHAVCVVDREEGGADALARLGVRLTALYRAGDLLATRDA